VILLTYNNLKTKNKGDILNRI